MADVPWLSPFQKRAVLFIFEGKAEVMTARNVNGFVEPVLLGAKAALARHGT
jgi:hypothetical protein